jgi:murein DD-endopeptidase MepM/ murein hydrolase activator NlpD
MVFKSDSLEREVKRNQAYLERISLILQGQDPSKEDSLSISVPQTVNPQQTAVVKSREDSILREYVEREDSYSLQASGGPSSVNTSKLFFFKPVEGTLIESFDQEKEHYGIDLLAPANEVIKATLAGTVIFSEWTVETGYVIQLQHKNNITSIYKHNSTLLKETGDLVDAGEAIAIIGNTGELSSGPHLHFELWQDGVPLDPAKYLSYGDGN